MSQLVEQLNLTARGAKIIPMWQKPGEPIQWRNKAFGSRLCQRAEWHAIEIPPSLAFALCLSFSSTDNGGRYAPRIPAYTTIPPQPGRRPPVWLDHLAASVWFGWPRREFPSPDGRLPGAGTTPGTTLGTAGFTSLIFPFKGEKRSKLGCMSVIPSAKRAITLFLRAICRF